MNAKSQMASLTPSYRYVFSIMLTPTPPTTPPRRFVVKTMSQCVRITSIHEVLEIHKHWNALIAQSLPGSSEKPLCVYRELDPCLSSTVCCPAIFPRNNYDRLSQVSRGNYRLQSGHGGGCDVGGESGPLSPAPPSERGLLDKPSQ